MLRLAGVARFRAAGAFPVLLRSALGESLTDVLAGALAAFFCGAAAGSAGTAAGSVEPRAAFSSSKACSVKRASCLLRGHHVLLVPTPVTNYP